MSEEIEACAALVASLLGACPGVRICATSREALAVTGEVVWPVPTLSVPEPPTEMGHSDVTQFAQHEAIALFMERTRLLSEAERLVFRRLSLFLGGFALEAAEAVCPEDAEADKGRDRLSDSVVCQSDVLDILTRLVDKSLLVMRAQGDQARYRLLDWQAGLYLACPAC